MKKKFSANTMAATNDLSLSRCVFLSTQNENFTHGVFFLSSLLLLLIIIKKTIIIRGGGWGGGKRGSKYGKRIFPPVVASPSIYVLHHAVNFF